MPRAKAPPRVTLTERGATIAFLAEELDKYGDALSALIEGEVGFGKLQDEHAEALVALYSKVRLARLLTQPEALTRGARKHLTIAELE